MVIDARLAPEVSDARETGARQATGAQSQQQTGGQQAGAQTGQTQTGQPPRTQSQQTEGQQARDREVQLFQLQWNEDGTRAVLLARSDEVKPADLGLQPSRGEGGERRLEEMSLEEVERLLIQKALRRFGGNVSQAAEALGLSRSALYRRMQKYEI